MFFIENLEAFLKPAVVGYFGGVLLLLSLMYLAHRLNTDEDFEDLPTFIKKYKVLIILNILVIAFFFITLINTSATKEIYINAEVDNIMVFMGRSYRYNQLSGKYWISFKASDGKTYRVQVSEENQSHISRLPQKKKEVILIFDKGVLWKTIKGINCKGKWIEAYNGRL